MKKKLYAALRNRSMFSRMYRSNLLIGVIPLVVLTIVFAVIYVSASVSWFESKERESLYYFGNNLCNKLYYFDNSIVTITQDQATQDCLNRWLLMSEYERYVMTDQLTDLVVEQLHMLDYVTDVVLITNNYDAIQLYGGPHGDFVLETLDYPSFVEQTFYQKTNTWIAPADDYLLLEDGFNQDGFFYAKRITASENNVINIGYILVYLDKESFFDLSALSYISGQDVQQYILQPDGRFVHSSLALEAEYQSFSENLAQHFSNNKDRFFIGAENPNGHISFCVYSRIAPLDWYVVTAIPVFSMFATVWLILLIMVLLIVGLVLVQSFLSTNIAYSVEVPVKEILQSLQRIENGDFTPSMEDQYQDELARVQNSLNYTIRLLDRLFQETKKHERDKFDLQFRALMSQMNPHFLMNSLNSVALLANLQGAGNIQQLCQALSRLLQDMLNSNAIDITLQQELSLLNDYALIMQYRYFDRFRVVYHIEVDAAETKIPRFILQPLLENALGHGLGEKTVFLTITLHAFLQDGDLVITVHDDGVGISAEKLAQLQERLRLDMEQKGNGQHIGLWNINRRIQLICGTPYGLTIDGKPGQGATVTIRLPY